MILASDAPCLIFLLLLLPGTTDRGAPTWVQPPGAPTHLSVRTGAFDSRCSGFQADCVLRMQSHLTPPVGPMWTVGAPPVTCPSRKHFSFCCLSGFFWPQVTVSTAAAAGSAPSPSGGVFGVPPCVQGLESDLEQEDCRQRALSYRKVIGIENKTLINRNLGVLRSVCVCEMKLPQSSWEPRKGP